MAGKESHEENMQAIMGLIMNGGDAKSSAMEAIYAAKEGDFAAADQKLIDANTALTRAHNAQTTMLTKEASGEHMEITLLMVHAQDHIMNAINFLDLAREVVDIHKKMAH